MSSTGNTEGATPSLSCIIAPIASDEGFAESDVRVIQNALQVLPQERASGLVIFADALETERGLTGTDLLIPLKRIFAVASEAANPSVVALVFCGVNHRILSLAIEEFNAAHDALEFSDVFKVPNPILIIAPHNRHFWAGGSRRFRELLSGLSEISAARDHLATQTALSGNQSDPELRQIRDQSTLLRVEDGRLVLTLYPQDVLDALASDLQVKLRDAYAEASRPGVQKGLFLTPSLRVTTRWSDPNEVLRSLGGERLAGFLLASVLERRALVKQAYAPSPLVVKVGNAGSRLLYSFSLSLGGSGEYFESVEYLKLELLDSTANISRHVILCTDLISSGFSLLKTIADLKRLGLTVDVIAAVVDARGSDDPFYQHDEFRFGNTNIPLVCLSSVSIGVQLVNEDQPDLLPIDPILNRPIKHAVPLPRHLKDQRSYIQALMATRAARLGHIRRPSDRHYSAYVDPTILFRNPQWAKDILWICRTKVLHRQRSIFVNSSAQPNICILYPGGTSDQLADVAQGLATELKRQFVSVDPIVNIGRGTLGSRWMFPVSIEPLSASPHVVILDSGTTSGHSVQQLTRLALAAGASAVTAIVLLDALSEADALALQQVRALGRPSTSQDVYEPENLIPFALYFISGTAVNSSNSSQCSICGLRRRFAAMRHPLPERLREHHAWLINTLQVRSKERVFQEEPTDLLGVPIDQQDCIEYLVWKSELQRAAVSTSVRRDLVEHIKSVSRDSTNTGRRDGLVRLLVAESHWLGVAPMWFPEARSHVVSIAEGLLSGPQAMSADPMLRVQAAILLALASPDDLVDDIASLIRDAQDHAPVVCQLLLEAHLLLDPPSGEPPAADLTERLVRRLAALEDQVSQAEDRWPWSESAPLEEVRSIIALGQHLLAPLPESPQEAWAALGGYRTQVRDHGFDPAMWRIQLRLENLSRGLAPRERDAFRLDWNPCREFLSVDVLPNLEQLRPILLSKRLMRGLNNDDFYTWNRVINGDGFVLLEDITNRLEKASILSDDEGLGDASNLAQLQADLRWWNDFFLAGNISDENNPRPAYLAEFIGTCPAYVMDVVKEAFDDTNINPENRGLTNDHALSVFCSTSLLKDLFSHIRMETERQPEDERSFRILVERSDNDMIAVTIMTDGILAAMPSRRRYLSFMQDELQRFGAGLKELNEVPAPWTYGICVTLERWSI